MNEPTNLELAGQFIADKRWRWVSGMRYQGRRSDGSMYGMRLDWVPAPGGGCTLSQILADSWPDVEDSATLGCIEHDLVPAALNDPEAFLCFDDHARLWYVFSPRHDTCAESKPTKPEALLAGLRLADDPSLRPIGYVVAEQVEEEFGDYDGHDDRDGDYDDPFEPRAYDPFDAPTDPKLCTRPPDPRAVEALNFLKAQRERDEEKNRKVIERRRAQEPTS